MSRELPETYKNIKLLPESHASSALVNLDTLLVIQFKEGSSNVRWGSPSPVARLQCLEKTPRPRFNSF